MFIAHFCYCASFATHSIAKAFTILVPAHTLYIIHQTTQNYIAAADKLGLLSSTDSLLQVLFASLNDNLNNPVRATANIIMLGTSVTLRNPLLPFQFLLLSMPD